MGNLPPNKTNSLLGDTSIMPSKFFQTWQIFDVTENRRALLCTTNLAVGKYPYTIATPPSASTYTATASLRHRMILLTIIDDLYY